MSKRLLFGVGAAGVGTLAALAAATPASATSDDALDGSTWFAVLSELNGSGAGGDAIMTVSDDGETMSVELVADGFNLDGPHAIHLHGIVEDGEVLASSCPTEAEDANGDGVVTVVEGAARYGTVQISLTNEGDTSPDSALAVDRFSSGTSIDYARTGIEIPEMLRSEAGKLHIVVHGIDENGNGTLDLDQTERSSLTDELPREATAPALCGTLTVLSEGTIETGLGAVAEPGGELPVTAIAGLSAAAIAAGGAGLAARRRLARRGTTG
jgi:hypothetical protein